MIRKSQENWADFRLSLGRFSRLSADRRVQFLFRGHADSGWHLRSTLDRFYAFDGDADRAECYNRLRAEFEQEMTGIADPGASGAAGLDLLARHHGLPSPYMDWTRSPYVAAFFAFESAESTSNTRDVWLLDRAKVPADDTSITILDDRRSFKFNPRGLRQRGAFLRLDTGRPLEDALAPALFCVSIPSAERAVALADLDAMSICAATLFGDLDGVARTASARIVARREERR